MYETTGNPANDRPTPSNPDAQAVHTELSQETPQEPTALEMTPAAQESVPQPEVTASPADFTAEPIPQTEAQPQTVCQAQPEVAKQPQVTTQTQATAQPQPMAQYRAASAAYAEASRTAATAQKSAAHKEKRSIPWGTAVALVLICGLLSLFAGFGGGLLAANRVGDQMASDINSNLDQYLEDNGTTVLYRSVSTETTEEVETPASLVTKVSDLAADSVVEIVTQVVTENPYAFFFGMGGQSVTQGAGSGVILSNDGYILTCYHVIKEASSIGVTLRDGTQYEATVVGDDRENDIAVLKIDAKGLTPAVLGSSSDLVVGSPVVAIGNPLGQLGGTVTAGYISALDRELTIDDETYNLLQTDAAINGGNSGGGLFNAKAESIGVEGLGFAIPIDDVASEIEDLINYGYITSRVSLGVTMVDIMDQRTAQAYRVEEYGVYLLSVEAGSNAEYAGLQPGDRIISVNDVEIENGDQVVEILSTCHVGDVLKIVLERDGQELTQMVTLYGALPEDLPSEPSKVTGESDS